jgi:hypothetical protein
MSTRLKYYTLYQQLNEIGDFKNIKSLPYNEYSPNSFEFKIDDIPVEVKIEKIDDKIKNIFPEPSLAYRNFSNKYYNVGFDIYGETDKFIKTDVKTLNKIIKTILDIVNKFIEKNDPDLLLIFTNDPKYGNVKIKYFTAVVSGQQLPQGYRWDTFQPQGILKGNSAIKIYKNR